MFAEQLFAVLLDYNF